MKVFDNITSLKIKTLAYFIIAIGLIFLGINVSFNTFFFNIIIFFAAIFVLMQALGFVDKINGYGPYNIKQQPNNNNINNNHHYTTNHNNYPHHTNSQFNYDDSVTDSFDDVNPDNADYFDNEPELDA